MTTHAVRFLLFITCGLSALVSYGQTSSSADLANTNLDTAIAAETPLDWRSLDYHLARSFLTPSGERAKAINHLGMETQPASGGGYLITAALEGYPAHTAGLRRGDVILEIDGNPFHPVLSFNPDAEEQSFVANDTPVTLAYRRDEALLSTRLTPIFESLYDSYRSATLNSVLSFAAGNKVIGYLRLWALTRQTADLTTLRLVLASLKDTDGLILDLRNSHGFLAAEHIDFFRASRSDFLTVSLGQNRTAPHLLPVRTRDESLRAYRRPIAILVDDSTRGAGELLAYQLAKLERVITLGEATPGRLGQRFLNESGELVYRRNSELRVDGQPFEGVGLTPKRAAPYPVDQTSRSDPQFQLAVNVLMGVI